MVGKCTPTCLTSPFRTKICSNYNWVLFDLSSSILRETKYLTLYNLLRACTMAINTSSVSGLLRLTRVINSRTGRCRRLARRRHRLVLPNQIDGRSPVVCMVAVRRWLLQISCAHLHRLPRPPAWCRACRPPHSPRHAFLLAPLPVETLPLMPSSTCPRLAACAVASGGLAAANGDAAGGGLAAAAGALLLGESKRDGEDHSWMEMMRMRRYFWYFYNIAPSYFVK